MSYPFLLRASVTKEGVASEIFPFSIEKAFHLERQDTKELP